MVSAKHTRFFSLRLCILSARNHPNGCPKRPHDLDMLSTFLLALSLSGAELQTLASPVDQVSEEHPAWEGTLGAGVSLSSGNTGRRSANALMDAELREEERRYTLGFDWQYADESDGGPSELLERRAGVNGKVDFFLDDRSYLLMTSDIETDDKAQLDLRYSAGVGYGYQVVEDEDWSLSFEAGLSHVNEEFTGAAEESFVSGRFGYAMKRVLWSDWVFTQNAEIFPSFEESSDIYVEVDSRIRCDFSENLYGQLQWLFDWDNTPAAGSERADHRLLFSVGYSF